MGKLYRFASPNRSTETQVIESIPRKPMARAYISRDVRRSVIDLLTRHDNTLRQATLKTQLSEQQVLGVLLDWCADERQKAFVQGKLSPRGPQPPARGAERRAA